MPILWVEWATFAIGIICLFGGGIAFFHYYGNSSFKNDKSREKISVIITVIGVFIILISFTGIIFFIP